MASSCLTCISAVSDDLLLLENLCPKTPDWECELFEMMSLKVYLGIFRTFLLCVRKWGDDDDANLGALVARMKDYISKLGQAIHKFYLTSVEDGYRMELAAHIPDDLEEEASSLLEEIKDLEYSTSLSSKSPVKKDDLMDIMDSLLESPRYIVYFAENQALYAGYAELSEDFAEKLTFLKNFFCFLTLHGFEDRQLGPLLTHIKSVAVNAACNNGVLFSKSSMSRDSPIRDLLQKIIFAEPEVHKTCVQALISSKLSRQPYKEKDENIFRDFIDSLLVYLWEILKTGTCIMISLKDRLKMLYDGLRSLRIILKENPNNFDEKMRDLTGLWLCDAGLVIFSLSLSVIKDGYVKEMDLESFMIS